ncbi:MAG TPA: deoxynucleoside kinase, partial [Burkholderiales bacterium]|nr:deoxynucleoside kinase [Burkholderiales bacterium]
MNGYFLAIAGNIGVGKTELTNRLSAELGWLAYYEPVIQNPYLDAFYADMRRWSFHLQIYFLSERFKAQVEISRSALPFIQDRTIY